MRLPQDGIRRHALLPEKILAKLPPLYASEGVGEFGDQTVVTKYFTPDSSWRWFMIEFDPDTMTGFGYIQGLSNEAGYFNLNELAEAKGPMGLPIERDLYWDPVPLTEALAQYDITL